MKKYILLLLIILVSCSKEELIDDGGEEPVNPNPIPQLIYPTSVQNHEWNDGWYSRERETFPVEFFSAYEYFDYDLDGAGGAATFTTIFIPATIISYESLEYSTNVNP